MPVRSRGRRHAPRAARLLAVAAVLSLMWPVDPVTAAPPGSSRGAGSGAIAPAGQLPTGAAGTTPGFGPPGGGPPRVGGDPGAACNPAPGRVLVTFRPTLGASGRASIARRIHGRSLHAFRLVPGLELVSTDLPVEHATAALRNDPGVVSVEPDCRRSIETTPNDPMFSAEWGLDNTGQLGGTAGADIDATDGWAIRTDASSVIVAIIDTGMQLDHPDLVANLWTNPGEIAGNGIDDDHDGYVDDVHGYDFINQDGDPTDDNGHGTHTAGTVGARGNNGIGVSGVAWAVKLMPVKALDANGVGYASGIIAALDYAVAKGARISNNSYSGAVFERAEYEAFVAAGAAGHLAVAAAGNDDADIDERPHYPAAYHLDSILSVEATTPSDERASFSDFGAMNVDLAAPGVSILSTWPGGYQTLSGTSMAAPHVAGVAALVQAAHPSWSGQQVRDRLIGTTRPVAGLAGSSRTGGVVDAAAALGNGPTVLPPDPPDPSPVSLSPSVDPNPSPDPVAAPTPPTFAEPEVLESSDRNVGAAPQIALDSQGHPAIAYARYQHGIQLLTRSGGGWAERSLTNAYDDVYWFDLGYDAADVPQLVVQRAWSSIDRYSDPGIVAVNGTIPSPTETRLTASCPDLDSCLWDWTPRVAFDAAGAEHVAFFRSEPLDQDMVKAPAGHGTVAGAGLYYATNATGSWVVRRLTTDDLDGPPAIAVAPDGTVHVIANRSHGATSGLYDFTDDGGSWHALQLTDFVEDFWAAAAIDSSGALHVAFARATLGIEYLRRNADGTWTDPALIYDGAATMPDLAIDAADHVHVAFGLVDDSGTVAGVRYLTNRAGPWAGGLVAGGQAHDASIAVDAAGHAHIAYLQATGSPLGVFYATNATGAFVTTSAMPSSSEGGASLQSAATDASGHHHVAIGGHYGDPLVGLWYGTDASGAWSFSRVLPNLPSSVSLAVDTAGKAHIAFTETVSTSGLVLPPTSWRIGYVTNASGSWVVRNATVGTTFGAGVALALDPSGHAVLVYPDAGLTHLRRARWSGSSWTTDTVYTTPTGWGNLREPAALVASTGELDVAFGAQSTGDAGIRTMLLRGTTGSWSAASVTDGAAIHSTPSIARAADGTIWITDWTSDSVVSAHRRSPSGSWTHTVLDSTFGASWPTVAVDAAGLVHVTWAAGAFYSSSGCSVPECPAGPGLRHGVFDGASWTTTKLSPFWSDTVPMVTAAPDGAVTVVFLRVGSGLRSLELVPAKPAATIALEAGSDSGSSQTDRLTNAASLTFDVRFDRPVTGLSAADFTRSGTATGCVIQPVTGSAAAYAVSVTGCSAGTVGLTLKAGAVADGTLTGPIAATPSGTVTIDRTAPTVGIPTVTPRVGARLSGTSIPVRVTWTAADSGGSGLASYQVSRSTDGGLTWTALGGLLSTAGLDTTPAPSGTIRYRVQASDRAGNVRTGSATPTLSPRLTQQTAFGFAGTWSTSSAPALSGGSSRWSSRAGASATYRFRARAAAIIATRSATRGKVRIYVDGVAVATVDTRASTTQYRVLVWERRWTSLGTHTVRLVVLGTSGRPRIDLDAIALIK